MFDKREQSVFIWHVTRGFGKRHETGAWQSYRGFEACTFVSLRMAAILRTPDAPPILDWFIHFLPVFCSLFKPQFDEDATLPSAWKTVGSPPGNKCYPAVPWHPGITGRVLCFLFFHANRRSNENSNESRPSDFSIFSIAFILPSFHSIWNIEKVDEC